MLPLFTITKECLMSIIMMVNLNLLDNKKVEFRTHYKKRGGTEKPQE